ncbi:sulfatase-like hydrolase/transferase [Rubripirellula reticaptiva]|uniref:Choline-sulfatase n=1 Tax=Rubripirellula reticaptiva TaxID=2528013 RepID=A0A5C6EHH8_9BACT|nr:sulfatase-like hydrolase/transferase [Rubripirellula reticaptiva]TWU48000.1 Choline-sulfatase [Rubripirellula reticaptiva]
MSKTIFHLLAVTCLSIGFGSVLVAAERPASAPNIILVMSDDQGWGDVGFNGNEDIITPNLDAMAGNGVRFDRFYAAAPLCSPTRGSCLTGRFPFRLGILAAHTSGLRVGEITLAEMLKKQKYETGFFGKWHIGWVKPDELSTRGHYSPPSHHGFDEVFATTSAVPTWDPAVTPEGWDSKSNKPGEPWKGGFPYMHNGQEAKENLNGDDSRVIMDRVIPFVEQNKNQRFFAAVWFHTPHEPVVAGEEYKKPYAKFGQLRQNYYGCITAMDEQIGRLRDKLRELGVEKETLVFFCSDNGPGDKLANKGVASAGPFKGHKHHMYEGGVLVPACAEWPGVIESGSVTDVRCSTIDYFPTIAKLVDYSFSGSQQRPIDGVDLMPIIRGDSKQRDKDMFFGFRRLHDGVDGKSIISGNFKLMKEAKKNGQMRLYDLSSDPYEHSDLSESQPKLFEMMSQKLEAMETSCLLSRDGADYSY